MTNGTYALLNASLVTVALALMLAGYRAVRRRELERHRAFMLAASLVQAIFLASFVTRFVLYGRMPYTGAWPMLFHAVLFTHEPLAVVSLPLVIAALVLALSGRYREHRRVAAMALPVWLYASTTGVLIYVLLYL